MPNFQSLMSKSAFDQLELQAGVHGNRRGLNGVSAINPLSSLAENIVLDGVPQGDDGFRHIIVFVTKNAHRRRT
jgi:hypothetical protein